MSTCYFNTTSPNISVIFNHHKISLAPITSDIAYNAVKINKKYKLGMEIVNVLQAFRYPFKSFSLGMKAFKNIQTTTNKANHQLPYIAISPSILTLKDERAALLTLDSDDLFGEEVPVYDQRIKIGFQFFVDGYSKNDLALSYNFSQIKEDFLSLEIMVKTACFSVHREETFVLFWMTILLYSLG